MRSTEDSWQNQIKTHASALTTLTGKTETYSGTFDILASYDTQLDNLRRTVRQGSYTCNIGVLHLRENTCLSEFKGFNKNCKCSRVSQFRLKIKSTRLCMREVFREQGQHIEIRVNLERRRTDVPILGQFSFKFDQIIYLHS